MPTRVALGSLSRKVSAAACAADSRSGSRSVAAIEPEWSVTRTTDAPSTGTATVRCGLASASASAAIAASASTVGTWRRQGETAPAARASVAAAGKRIA